VRRHTTCRRVDRRCAVTIRLSDIRTGSAFPSRNACWSRPATPSRTPPLRNTSARRTSPPALIVQPSCGVCSGQHPTAYQTHDRSRTQEKAGRSCSSLHARILAVGSRSKPLPGSTSGERLRTSWDSDLKALGGAPGPSGRVAAPCSKQQPCRRDPHRRDPAAHAPSSYTCSAFIRTISVATPTSLLRADLRARDLVGGLIGIDGNG
jgi:hypothetical protein